jgi:hypothetical protein
MLYGQIDLGNSYIGSQHRAHVDACVHEQVTCNFHTQGGSVLSEGSLRFSSSSSSRAVWEQFRALL